MPKCATCQKDVIPLEENLSKKMINRGTKIFYCKHCLALKLGLTEERLDQLVEVFKKQGCSLFID